MVNLENMRYIIDTSSILSQKDDEPHRRKINKTLCSLPIYKTIKMCYNINVS